MNGQGTFLRNALVASIAVLMIGFVGLGVRALEPAHITHVVFLGLFVVSIVILVLYFILHPSIREITVQPSLRTPLFVKRPIPPSPSTTRGNPVALDRLPAGLPVAGSPVVKIASDSPANLCPASK
ncbi:MAG: hypothetical protein WA369_11485 [Candidatus Acidiferrales bacterium]